MLLRPAGHVPRRTPKTGYLKTIYQNHNSLQVARLQSLLDFFAHLPYTCPSPNLSKDSAMPSTRLIKKYPNRRLYDTAISTYITLADVKQMILEGENIRVVDAKNDDDLTRQVLLQILLEEEAGGRPILSNDMLCRFIRIYGHDAQAMLTPFLEQNMRLFADWQQNTQHMLSHFPLNNPSLYDFKQLQQNAVQFWQQMGWLPKNK